MTKEGFAQVLVPVATYNQLKTLASENGLSLGRTINKLIENYAVTNSAEFDDRLTRRRSSVQIRSGPLRF